MKTLSAARPLLLSAQAQAGAASRVARQAASKSTLARLATTTPSSSSSSSITTSTSSSSRAGISSALPSSPRPFSTSRLLRNEQPPADDGSAPRQGLLRSLLHGSETARAEGVTTSSHSTQVARGKYIHEIVRHSIHASKIPEYRAIIADYYPKISAQADRYHAKLIGSWQVAVGELETFYHIWQYDGYEGYDACRADLWPSPLQQEIEAKLAPCLKGRSNWLTQEFAFWPTAHQVNKSGPAGSPNASSSSTEKNKDWIFELRTYHLRPGMLLEWETHWRRGLEARRRYVEPVGAWFTQCGQLHTVFHIWAYPSLENRKRTRDAAWQVETWSETVSSTVKLIDSMHAQILYPTEFSPLK